MVRKKKKTRDSLTADQAATVIQAVVRGHLGRNRAKHTRLNKRRLQNQQRFANKDSATHFYHIQIGAAITLQRWFRRLPWHRKALWRVRYAKAIVYLKALKRLNFAIKKGQYMAIARKRLQKTAKVQTKAGTGKSSKSSKAANSVSSKSASKSKKSSSVKNNAIQPIPSITGIDDDIAMPLREQYGIVVDVPRLCEQFPYLSRFVRKHGPGKLFDVATVVTRLVRAFNGRHRCLRLRVSRHETLIEHNKYAVQIQRIARGCLVRQSPTFAHIGLRTRAWTAKLRRWRPSTHANKKEVSNVEEYRGWRGRRNAISFANLRLHGSAHLEELPMAAVTVQRIVRGRIIAANKIAKIKAARKVYLANSLRQVHCARQIQRIVRRFLTAQAQLHNAARKIHQRWHTNTTFKLLVHIRQVRLHARCRLQRWCRRVILCRLRYRKVLLARKRLALETAVAGKQHFINTETFAHIDAMWTALSALPRIGGKTVVQAELQQLYAANSPQGGLEFARLSKLVLACPDLVPPPPGSVKDKGKGKDKDKSKGNDKGKPGSNEGSRPTTSVSVVDVSSSIGGDVDLPTIPTDGLDGNTVADDANKDSAEGSNDNGTATNTFSSRPVTPASNNQNTSAVPARQNSAEASLKPNTKQPSDFLDIKAVERLYLKVKPPKESKMSYPKFLELLFQMAAMKYLKITTEQLGKALADFESFEASENNNVNNDNDNANDEKGAKNNIDLSQLNEHAEAMAAFKYGRLLGRSALVTRLVFDYFRAIPSFQEIEKKLTGSRKSAWSQSQALIANCASKLRRFVQNRLCIKRITRQLKAHKAEKTRRRQDVASRRIQTLIRYFLSRVRVMRIAQMVYSKFVDGELNREYWFNNRTGQSFWVKPGLLGYLDCGLPVQTPLPSESCVVTCTSCFQRNATCFCHDCNLAFCNQCYPGYHRSDRRKSHMRFELENCVQCDFQVGTKLCKSCKDIFCDTCFRFIHKKGRLRLHTFAWITDSCSVCHERACRWQVVPLDDDNNVNGGIIRDALYCSLCYPVYELNNGVPPDEKVLYPKHTLRYKYHGRHVKAYRDEIQARLEREEKERQHLQRLAEYKEIQRGRAALTIQRCWRGHRTRVHLQDFINQRKSFYSLRLTEMKVRESWWYRFFNFFGIAPPLASDTPKERILKMYPAFLHKIVIECINNDWRNACRMLLEEEKYFPSVKSDASGVIRRPNWFARRKLKRDLNKYRQSLTHMEQEIQLKLAVFTNVKQTFRDARAAGKLAKDKEEQFLQSIKDAEEALNTLREQKDQHEATLRMEEDRIEHLVGSRGVHTMIADRRRNGIELPFRVHMVRGCRLAATEASIPGQPTVEVEDSSLLALAMGNNEESGKQQSAEIATTSGIGDGDNEDDEDERAEWRKYLKHHDLIKINGVTYEVTPEHYYSLADDDNDANNDDDDTNDNDGATTIASAMDSELDSLLKKSKKSSKNPGVGGDDDSSVKSLDISLGDEEDDATVDEEALQGYLYVPRRPHHIVLDKPWVFDDRDEVKIFKCVQVPIYQKSINAVGKSLKEMTAFQKFIAIIAINCYKLAQLSRRISGLFDEESESAASWRERAASWEQSRDNVLKLSVLMVAMSYDFTLRRQTWTKLRRIYRQLSIAIKDLRESMRPKKQQVELGDSPYQRWSKSVNRVDVVVLLDTIAGAIDPVALGVIQIDLEAPCDVLRECVQRQFRMKLNETIGDSFNFNVNDPNTGEKTLIRRLEKTTKTGLFAPFKMNNRTMEGRYTTTLVLEKGAKKVFIPEFADAAADAQNQEMQRLANDAAASADQS